MSDKLRVMVISHGHPDLSPGGAELAAHALFKQLRARSDTTALFVARTDPAGDDGPALGQHSDDGSEVLLRSDSDHFRHSQRRPELLNEDFPELLRWYRPDVVHFHHYSHLGLELLRVVRNYSPTVPIILTLHEYLAICHAKGQLIRTQTKQPCERPSPAACHSCFPTIPAEDFLLRELFIKSFIGLVDRFVSPSEFLVDRYVEWGLSRDQFSVIENPVPIVADAGSQVDGEDETFAGRFGFFGQFQPNKGLDVLLRAVSLLPRELVSDHPRITVDVWGSRLDEQVEAYRTSVDALLRKTSRTVVMHGPYARRDVAGLMGSVDWVVIPSVWWENSPTVIQEAFASGVPVIASGVGGMAEKVTDGVDGLHFRMGDARHLAERMVEAATAPGLHARLASRATPPPDAAIVTSDHVKMYLDLRK